MDRSPSAAIQELVARFAQLKSGELNEAATRLLFINGVLSEVLGWPLESLNPEQYVASIESDTPRKSRKWIDYHIRSGEALRMVVEAKRVGQTFALPTNRVQRTIPLRQLIQNHGEELSKAIGQARKYSVEVGTYAFIVTNGYQWIASLAFAHMVEADKLQAVVFYSLEDIQQHLSEFVDLLSPDGLANQRLMAKAILDANLVPTFARRLNDVLPASFPPADRNYLTKPMAALMNMCFGDLTDEEHAAMLTRCYVSNDATDEYLSRLESFVGGNLPYSISDATPISRSLGDDALSDPKGVRPGVSLAIGRAGSGKSTFLAITRQRLQQAKSEQVLLHVDLIGRTQTHARTFDHDLMVSEICHDLLVQAETQYPNLNPYANELLREIFAREIKRLKISLSPGNRESVSADNRVDELIQQHLANKAAHLKSYLGFLERRGTQTIVLLDNVDRGTVEFERVTFQLAQTLAQNTNATVVISLRDTTYESGRIAGFLDVGRHNLFAISPPPFVEVARRRFDYARDRLRDDPQLARRFNRLLAGVDVERVLDFANIMAEMILGPDSGTRDCIQALAGTNIRRALELLEEFATSPNTDLNRLFGTYQKHHGRNRIESSQETDQFLRSVMRLRSMRYAEASSKIINIFQVPSNVLSSHFIGVRMMQLLLWRATRSDDSNELRVSDAVSYLAGLGHTAGQTLEVLNKLGRYGLVVSPSRSEPPWKPDDSIRIGAAGRYYVEELIFNREYLKGLADDTVVYEEPVFSAMKTVHDDQTRRWPERYDEKVRILLTYLGRRERDELIRPGGAGHRPAWATPIVEQIGTRYFGAGFTRDLRDSNRPKPWSRRRKPPRT